MLTWECASVHPSIHTKKLERIHQEMWQIWERVALILRAKADITTRLRGKIQGIPGTLEEIQTCAEWLKWHFTHFVFLAQFSHLSPEEDTLFQIIERYYSLICLVQKIEKPTVGSWSEYVYEQMEQELNDHITRLSGSWETLYFLLFLPFFYVYVFTSASLTYFCPMGHRVRRVTGVSRISRMMIKCFPGSKMSTPIHDFSISWRWALTRTYIWSSNTQW